MGKYRVYFDNAEPMPAEYEVSAAEILAEYFRADVKMVRRRMNARTPDLEVVNVLWELKSPTGDGKRTIQNNLRKASGQASRIVIDLRRCKMHEVRAISRIKYELTRANNIARLLVITKRGKVLVIK